MGHGGQLIDADWDWLLAGVDRVWAPVANPLGITLALLMTGHVLLRKRDVAAVIGWIGLAWLAPVWGALFYLMFGINRVVRRARALRGERQPRPRDVRLAPDGFAGALVPFERAVRRITKRPAEEGNSVRLLHNGEGAYPEMLAAIEAAQTSLVLATYIMRDDPVGRRFVAALEAAHARGVEVRVLLDGIGSGYFPTIGRHLRRHGIPTALFMHSALPWRMPFLNLRNHKKVLVADGRVAFTGGLNIAAENEVESHPPRPVADTHFRVEGPVVSQLVDAFARDWDFATGEDLDGPIWHPSHDVRGDAVARVITSGPDQDLEKIEFVLLEALACATTSVRIMTPYFLPGEQLVTALILAAMRGVDVEIVVPARSNHRVVDLAMRAHIAPLLDAGVRFWHGKTPFNHSKLMVVDRRWCLVGSANWDMRSLRLNFELDLEVYDAGLAAEIEALIVVQAASRLRPADLSARRLPIRLRDAGLRLLLPYI